MQAWGNNWHPSGLKALPAVKLGRREEAPALGFGFKRVHDDSVNVPWMGGERYSVFQVQKSLSLLPVLYDEK